MKRIFTIMVILLLISVMGIAAEETTKTNLEKNDIYDDELTQTIEGDIYEDIGDVTLEGSAGLTPDSTFYFMETLVESILVGDDPEKALKYKEEKVLELKEMLESDNKEAAEKALEGVNKYNDIIQKEVSPDIEKKVRKSSKAVKGVLNSFEDKLKDEDWEDVQKGIDASLKQEDKIALAAKISKKIGDLCETLSDLDPLEYAKVCKSGDDSPKWKRDLDERLTKEQKEEAREFMGIMGECFANPSECRCDDISIKPFAEKCKVFAPLVAKCESGDKDACQEMEEQEDPINLLPDYLQDVMEDLEDQYGDAKHDLFVPPECIKEGATTKEACMKVMFKLHAPPECAKACEEGLIDPKNEHEGRKACEEIMFKSEAPQECINAGLKDFRECERYMFKLDAPKECLDAGLDGSGRSDWKKCEVITFRLDAPKECLDAGITGEARDDWKKCDAIRFRLDAPKECLDAGLDGLGKDDWKKCDKIRFLLDAPEECHKFKDERDPWKSCQPLQFKLDAPKECLDAGLDGTGRDDWRKCDAIRFKLDAPPECINAGLDGSGKNDWRECDKIRKDTESQGDRKEDCAPDELHICNGNICKCTSDPNDGCGALDCQQGYSCQYGQCFPDDGGCEDCASKCPGASRTDCINDKCECYYEDKKQEDEKQEESECKNGCQQECGDQNTDCVGGKCVCLGYGENGPPTTPPPSHTDPVQPLPPDPVPIDPVPIDPIKPEPVEPQPVEPNPEPEPSPPKEDSSSGDDSSNDDSDSSSKESSDEMTGSIILDQGGEGILTKLKNYLFS